MVKLMKRLLTLIQVSDMHFGRPDPISAEVKDWWCRFPALSGYFGHCGRALRYLDDEIAKIRANEPDTVLLMSGDLTAYASDEQFILAISYLEGQAYFSHGRSMGLQFGHSGTVKIPGNHDHWSGKSAMSPLDLVMYGGPTDLFRSIFLPMPKVLLDRPLDNDRRLLIVGLDTDAGLTDDSPSKFLARGSFVGQLQQAEDLFDGDPTSEIRVLVMHHSRMHMRFVCGIHEKSRKALDQFLVRHRVRVLLTGHVHVCRSEVETLHDQSSKWVLLESRCGTTSQRSLEPVGCPKMKLQPNSFLVHRLYCELDGSIRWEVEEFVRGPWTPFASAGSWRTVSVRLLQ
jgi:hypothetical protein